MPSKYEDIIARMEKAEGPSRELDALIWSCIGEGEYGPTTLVNGRTMFEAIEAFPTDMAGIARAWEVERFSESIDAAVALCERMLPKYAPSVGMNVHYRHWTGFVNYIDERGLVASYSSIHSVPAIALLLALFRALQAQEESEAA